MALAAPVLRPRHPARARASGPTREPTRPRSAKIPPFILVGYLVDDADPATSRTLRSAATGGSARDGRRGTGDEPAAGDGGAGCQDAASRAEPSQPRRTVGRPRSAPATRGRLPTHPGRPLRLAPRAHLAVRRTLMMGAAPPPSSLPDDWTKPPSQPGQGSSGPGAPGPADSTGLPGRPTALISRQRRQTNTDRRLTEEVQQDVRPGPQSPGAPPEPSAGGPDHGATTARTGGGRVLDACGELYLASGRKLQRGRR